MGLEALPYQTTVFPIQMNGWSYDYMLAVDDVNCEERAKQRATVQTQVDDKVKEVVSAKLPEFQELIDTYGWETLCENIQWAYTESIDLNEDIEKLGDITKMFTTCKQIKREQQIIYATLESSNL